MRIRELAIPGCFEFTPRPHRDPRGTFAAPLQEDAFLEAVGHPLGVAQVNHSRSAKGVLRGVHFTEFPPGQAKYVHCVRGRALDVVVDLRLGSPTFGVWDATELDADSLRAVYLPIGMGHAFLAVEENTVMSYLVSSAYKAEREHAVDPFDPELALPWPEGGGFVLSDRDASAPSLRAAAKAGILPRYEAPETVGAARAPSA